MRNWLVFALAWVLILGGGWLAHAVQTAGGVKISEVRIPTSDGATVSGLLYVPPTATPQTRAPAILASHGYINTREMQSPFAIELAHRGFVVLAMDMTGHGYSGGVVGTADYGGPAALAWLRARPFVDPEAIGLEGHSMGGAPILAAAAAYPDGYRAIVLEGSTPGLLGAKAPESPKNLAVVFGRYEEFAELMWQVPTGADVVTSKRLMALFGTDQPVQPGRVYGDVADGSARRLYTPPVTHPGEHFSEAGVEAALDWFRTTLTPGEPASMQGQTWLLKEIGTLIAFGGLCLLILATFDLLLGLPLFRPLAQPAQPANVRRGRRWWLAFAITAALPALTYFPLMKVGQLFFPMPGFPQWVHNQLLVWALGTGLITLLIGLVLRAKAQFTPRWGLSILAAAATMGVAFAASYLLDGLFKADFRFWVLGLKPLSAERAVMMLPYLALWAAFFVVAIRSLAANLAVQGESLFSQVGWAKIAMSLGFVVLVVWEYATLFATGRLATPAEPLNTIVAIQFVPLLAVIGAIGAWTYRRTNSYVPGALICAVLIAWYVTSGTAVHWAPGYESPLLAAVRR
jgi:dienelactone hydrolase